MAGAMGPMETPGDGIMGVMLAWAISIPNPELDH